MDLSRGADIVDGDEHLGQNGYGKAAGKFMGALYLCVVLTENNKYTIMYINMVI